jgi:hypothetical protein
MQLHTTNTAQQKTKTGTMISPACQLPAALILQVSVITVCCAINLDLCNPAM